MSAPVLGTCGLCGGPVAESIFPTGAPACLDCGAVKKNPFGPVIEMVPPKPSPFKGDVVASPLAVAPPNRQYVKPWLMPRPVVET